MPITHATVATDPNTPLLGADEWNAAHTVEDDSFTIAKTAGLQAALDAKQASLTKLAITSLTPTNVVWSGVAAPSGTVNHKHSYVNAGGFVTGMIRLQYATAGTTVTQVDFDLPSDWPTPDESDLSLGASGNYLAYAGLLSTSNTSTGNTARTYLKKNAANNGWTVTAIATAGNHKLAFFTISYWAG